ncbi:DivIVA domain-containing protein [Vagococcus elongatus]|uniref:Cell division protein DivIVA n=1 Tax=Vagococcus elongatus TaxID=180344 RepID=A0A430AYF3_9ENTE|nr:DivIVA domain-containing protein [Vagococcus elongatus]RSU13065.1 hypothetical protein CBF29_05190 [Vagococcus elongatus]
MAALTPLDIKNKSFSTKFKGYNPDEVDDFLDQVIDDYEDSVRKVKELEKNLKHAEEKLTYFNELKDALNQSIIVAQDTADKLKNTASKESDVLVSTAQADARAILDEANATAEATVADANRISSEILKTAQIQASQLANETDDLKKKTREFHRNLSLILESQLEIVKGREWDDLLKPFSTYMDERHTHVRELLENEEKMKEELQMFETTEVEEELGEVAESSTETTADGHTQAIELDAIEAEENKNEIVEKNKPKYSRVRRSRD